MQSARQSGVCRKCQFIQSFFDNLFRIGNAQIAYIYAALRSFCRFHLSFSV